MPDPVEAKSEARRQMHLGYPQQSVGLLEQVLRANPLDAEANALMGAALSQGGNEAAAIPYFEQAVRLEPNRAANHYNLGVAYERVGNLAWAIEGYRQALLRDADFLQAARAYYRLAPEYAPASVSEPGESDTT